MNSELQKRIEVLENIVLNKQNDVESMTLNDVMTLCMKTRHCSTCQFAFEVVPRKYTIIHPRDKTVIEKTENFVRHHRCSFGKKPKNWTLKNV